MLRTPDNQTTRTITPAGVEFSTRTAQCVDDRRVEHRGARLGLYLDHPANILGCNRSRLADNKPALAVELEACAKDVVTIENNLKSRGQLLHTVKPVRRVEKSRLGERIETSEIGAEPVEPPLSHRHQRHEAHAVSGKFLEHLGFVVLGRCQQNRKTGDRFHLEDVTRGEDEPGIAGTGDELNRHDRIAAHREERVVDAHRFDTEDIDEQGGQRAFGIGFGGPRACLGCSQVGNRQARRSSFPLAVIGSSSRTTTTAGTMYGARAEPANAMTASGSTV